MNIALVYYKAIAPIVAQTTVTWGALRTPITALDADLVCNFLYIYLALITCSTLLSRCEGVNQVNRVRQTWKRCGEGSMSVVFDTPIGEANQFVNTENRIAPKTQERTPRTHTSLAVIFISRTRVPLGRN